MFPPPDRHIRENTQLVHVDREIRICHHPRQGVHDEIRVAAAREIKCEMVSRTVERAKKWNSLNVVEMEMAEEDVCVDRLVAVFLLKVIAEVADAGSAVENQNLICVGSD